MYDELSDPLDRPLVYTAAVAWQECKSVADVEYTMSRIIIAGGLPMIVGAAYDGNVEAEEV